MQLPSLARLALAAAAPLVLVPLAAASGTRVGLKDAFATARGNAFVATADNPSAIYYNPAGLTQLPGAQASANIYEIALSSEYRGAGGSASMDDSYQAVPSLYATWMPAGSSWALGLGVYAPFGLSTEWSQSSPLRTLALKNKLTCVTYNLSAAWEPSPRVSLGASLTWNKADVELNRALGVFGPNDLLRFAADGHAASFNLGLLWKPADQHSFGLSYSHGYTVGLSGTTDTIPLVTGERSTADWEFPTVIIAGWSFRPTPDWNFEANIDWTDWGRFQTVTVRKPSGNLPLAFNWDSGCFYEFGVTRYLPGGWHVSAGWFFTENSVPDATYTPAVPDSNRRFYSLGGGYRGEQFSVDLTWQYADGGTRRVSGSPASLIGATADGTYRNRINALSLSAAFRF